MEGHWKLIGIQRKSWSKSEILFTTYSKGVTTKEVAITIAAPVLGWKALWSARP